MSDSITTIDGHTVYIDTEDSDLVSQYRWRIDGCGYALTNIKENSKWTTIRMHRLILSSCGEDLSGRIIDHIDRNKRNNCKTNLRVANKTINALNRNLAKNNKSGHRGVCFIDRNSQWRASIGYKMQIIYLGQYPTADHAAAAYNTASELLFGEDGYQNQCQSIEEITSKVKKTLTGLK